jgi:hypothetical protein
LTDIASSNARPRRTARELDIRRDRIFARLLEGQTYGQIAVSEAVTPRRIRQIVQDALAEDGVDPKTDFVFVQIARLEGALRLVEQKMAEGKLNAVDRLVKVLERLDRYHQQSVNPSSGRRRDEWLSAEMLAKLDRIAASRVAVAHRFVPPSPFEENSFGMDNGEQDFDFADFAETSDEPEAPESKA